MFLQTLLTPTSYYYFRDSNELPEDIYFYRYLVYGDITISKSFSLLRDDTDVYINEPNWYYTNYPMDILVNRCTNEECHSFMDSEYEYSLNLPIFKVAFDEDGNPYPSTEGEYQNKEFYVEQFQYLYSDYSPTNSFLIEYDVTEESILLRLIKQ